MDYKSKDTYFERMPYHDVYAKIIGSICDRIAGSPNLQQGSFDEKIAKKLCILNYIAACAIVKDKEDYLKKARRLEEKDIYEVYYRMMEKMVEAKLVAVDVKQSWIEKKIFDDDAKE